MIQWSKLKNWKVMTEGFIFDNKKCVACGACSAACILENKWSFSPRTIYTFNSMALPSLPVINLSLACNHCQTAVCMEGCPSSAYFREPSTGAVILDETKCIGCRFCQWNCPYDAPKYLISQKVIGKCNLCNQRLIEGLLPACSTSCPTGALNYGKLNDQSAEKMIPWMPEKKLRPSVELTGGINQPLKIIPQNIFDSEMGHPTEKDQYNSGRMESYHFQLFNYSIGGKSDNKPYAWSLSGKIVSFIHYCNCSFALNASSRQKKKSLEGCHQSETFSPEQGNRIFPSFCFVFGSVCFLATACFPYNMLFNRPLFTCDN